LIDELLGRGATSDKIDAEQFDRYFDKKGTGVRSTIPLVYQCHPSNNRQLMRRLTVSRHAVSLDEVVAAVKALLDKSCTLDVLPTRLLQATDDVISPFLTQLFN